MTTTGGHCSSFGSYDSHLSGLERFEALQPCLLSLFTEVLDMCILQRSLYPTAPAQGVSIRVEPPPSNASTLVGELLRVGFQSACSGEHAGGQVGPGAMGSGSKRKPRAFSRRYPDHKKDR
jgi:hypothetical protein